MELTSISLYISPESYGSVKRGRDKEAESELSELIVVTLWSIHTDLYKFYNIKCYKNESVDLIKNNRKRFNLVLFFQNHQVLTLLHEFFKSFGFIYLSLFKNKLAFTY